MAALCVAIKTMFAIRTASIDEGIKKFEIVAAITACIDLVVSIASVVIGALHLISDECHHAATFVLVNGCITLPFTLIAIALMIARFYGHSDFNIGASVDKVEVDIVEVDVVDTVVLESSFMLKTSGIVIPTAATSRIPINKGISSFFLLWTNPFPSDISLKDVNLSFFEWL